MILFPNAKINLGLHVVGKRTDGFHDIETVFYPVGLCDILEIITVGEGETVFTSSGIPIPGPTASNLCIKALNQLSSYIPHPTSHIPHPTSHILHPASHIPHPTTHNLHPASHIPHPTTHNPPPLHIHLHKSIPMGAGLGGGSSDGAYTIKLVDKLFKLNLSMEQMEAIARKLGSDCAFFIRNKPVLASGKGDQFSACSVDLSQYYIVVVKPDIHVATSDAYGMLTPEKPGKILPEILSQPIESWKNELVNDFEGAVFSRFPEIGKIKQKFYEKGALYASMSGSGSAVYGIFSEKPTVEGWFPGCFIWEGTL